MSAVACGDNVEPAQPIPDASLPEVDAPPPLPPDGLQPVLDAEDGPVDNLGVVQVWVTYLKPLVGSDPAGFFVQRDQTGPALFVAVDPATLSPVPAVGDQVSFVVQNVATNGGLRMADAIAEFVVDEPGGDVSGLVQNVSEAPDLVSDLGGYAAELVTISARFSTGFSAGGTGHMKAEIDSAVITDNPDLELRVPETIATALDATYTTVQGCSVTTAPTPLWRFFDNAQVSVWDEAELLEMNCTPVVLGALPTGLTSVSVFFNRPIDPASITDAATQFTLDNGLSVSAATVNGATVNLTTADAQDSATTYTVTVADTVLDVVGAGVDQTANTATFTGFEVVPPPDIVINEVDYDQTVTGDPGEFVELYNFGATDVDLSNLALVLINGNGEAEYNRFDLGALGTLPAGGYLVVGNAGLTVDPAALFLSFPNGNTVQNGSPDGVALVDTAQFSVIDSLSYEGSITAATINGFPGTWNLVEGTAASAQDSNSTEGSLSRTPNGSDTNEADTDWQFATTSTPGAANN